MITAFRIILLTSLVICAIGTAIVADPALGGQWQRVGDEQLADGRPLHPTRKNLRWLYPG